MTELKTLKDLKTRIESKQLGFILLEKELKQEAIKWIKFLSQQHQETLDCDGHYILNRWKEFFNITEEELK